MEKLSGDYIAGFVDGEGCFALKFLREVKHGRKGKPEYFYWDIEFAVGLREDDKEILERMRETLGCGKISVSKRGQARYAVNNVDDLIDKIVPFFEEYTLQAKKKNDFILWKEALQILIKNKQKRITGQRGFTKVVWSGEEDIKRLKQIHQEMTPYKSKRNPWKWL